MGLSGEPRPERDSLMQEASWVMAASWPKIVSLRSRSSVASLSRSLAETLLGGTRAILATVSSMSLTCTVLRRRLSGKRRRRAPASSMTSMALSGRWRSVMWRADSSTAERSAPRVNCTW